MQNTHRQCQAQMKVGNKMYTIYIFKFHDHKNEKSYSKNPYRALNSI